MVISQLLSKNEQRKSFIYLVLYTFSTANDIDQTDYFNFIKLQTYLMVNILSLFFPPLFEDWTFHSKKYAVEFVFSSSLFLFGLILNNDDA